MFDYVAVNLLYCYCHFVEQSSAVQYGVIVVTETGVDEMPSSQLIDDMETAKDTLWKKHGSSIPFHFMGWQPIFGTPALRPRCVFLAHCRGPMDLTDWECIW